MTANSPATVEHYTFNSWSDAPERGSRESIDCDEAEWMPLHEAVAELSVLPAPTVMPLREFIAWRLSHGLLSAKAGQLIQRYDGDPSTVTYYNMPITVEWSTEAWSAAHGEHWASSQLRAAVLRFGGRQTLLYSDIALDREGVSRLKSLIIAQNSLPERGGAVAARSGATSGSPQPSNDAAPFNNDERRGWMAEQPMMSADKAHILFKRHSRYDGTKQAEFRAEWKEVKETGRGRPPLKS